MTPVSDDFRLSRRWLVGALGGVMALVVLFAPPPDLPRTLDPEMGFELPFRAGSGDLVPLYLRLHSEGEVTPSNGDSPLPSAPIESPSARGAAGEAQSPDKAGGGPTPPSAP